MTDIPIIFSAPMIRAFLDGRKTMTRRLAWRPVMKPRSVREGDRLEYEMTEPGMGTITAHLQPSPWQRVKVGDRLWVRESGVWYIEKIAKVGECPWAHYRATDEDAFLPGMKWRPAIHMPRWVSRLTLIVEATKIEPLQAISEHDARAEGIEFRDNCFGTWNGDGTMRCGGADNAVEAFRCLWINLHGSGSWEVNPEVVPLTVRVINANIDEISPPHKTHTAALAGSA